MTKINLFSLTKS